MTCQQENHKIPRMDKRVALVTGGAKRVGRAIVEKLAASGLAVAFTYHSSEDEAEQLAKSINGLAIRADLTKPDSAPTEIFHRFKSRFNRLDVLVNNASLYSPARLKETTLDLL